MSKSIITSLSWALKGYASVNPQEKVDEKKMKEYEELNKKIKKKVKMTGNETLKEQTAKIEEQLENLEIDKEMNDEEDLETPVFCGDFKNYYTKGEKQDEDDYIEAIDDISDEDEEDYTIHKDDNLILCTSTEDGGFSTLEVYIFNGPSNNLYVHHDIVLSAYPLCVEWLPSYQNNNRANYAIVGTFLPEIEIWNLDVLDAIDPDVVLGNPEEEEKIIKNMKKKKSKLKNTSSDFHTDAVISLNLNPFDNNILASGGADSKVIIWDINAAKPSRNFREHKDRVQVVKWNKKEDNILLTTSSDKSLKLHDLRIEKSCVTINIPNEIECVDWNPLNQSQFLSSFDNGKIELFDIRIFNRRFLDFQAHKKAATSVSYSNQQNGLFASASLDCTVKIWDGFAPPVEEKDSSNTNNMIMPNLLMEKFVKNSTGELFCCKFADDLDYSVAVGGSKNSLFIWELEENQNFCSRYGLKYEQPTTKMPNDDLFKKRMMSNRIKMKGKKKFSKKK